MEGYTSENPAPKSDKDSAEKSSNKKSKKESLSDVISKTFESKNKDEAAQKIADSGSILERLTGKAGTKPEKPKDKSLEIPASKTADKETANLNPEWADGTIELPLDETTRDTAIEYIDLRGATVSEAQTSAIPETSESEVLGAEATLLVNARDQVGEASDGSSFTEAIDTAYTEASEAIAASATVKASSRAEEEAPQIAPGIDPAIVAQTYEKANASAGNTALTPAELSAKSEVEPLGQSWYYNADGSRRFYPGAWPPQPSKSPLEKITNDVRAEQRSKKIERNLRQDTKEQSEFVQQYIAKKEQLIREQAAESFAARPQVAEASLAIKSAPEEKFAWAPVPHTAETATQSPFAESFTSHPAEREQPLDKSELLVMSQKIIIDGTSLRTIYEAKQITEGGLRHITQEYLRGGDIKKALEQELLVKEMTYERDPQMRDRLAASYANLDAAAPKTSDDALAILHAQATEPARSMGPAVPPIATLSQRQGPSSEQLLMNAWTAVIVVLTIIAVILLFR